MSDATDAFRLPIGETLRDIARFLWRSRHDLTRIGATPVVLLTIWQVIAAHLLDIPDPAHPVPGAPPATLWDVLLDYGPDLLLIVMFAVAWHRRYLVPYEAATVWSALRWDRRKTRFLGHFVLIVVISLAVIAVPVTMLTIFVVIVNLAAAAPSAPPFEASALSSIVLLGAGMMELLLLLRLGIWLPSTAADAPFGLLECWRLGRQNTWRLSGIALGAALPVCVVYALWKLALAALPQDLVTVALLGELVHYALTYLLFAVVITTLSVCYDNLLARIADDPLYASHMPFRDE